MDTEKKLREEKLLECYKEIKEKKKDAVIK
jgi:hypothetical protein